MDSNAEMIARCVAGVIARIDMEIVDPKDWWQVLDAATDELKANTDYVIPEGHIHSFVDILLGAILNAVLYERMHKNKHGEYSDIMEVVDNEA